MKAAKMDTIRPSFDEILFSKNLLFEEDMRPESVMSRFYLLHHSHEEAKPGLYLCGAVVKSEHGGLFPSG